MEEDELAVQKELADKLITALKTGGFVLFAQQILPIAGSKERPYQEVLVRFKEEEEKLLPPGTFFPMLEEYHLLPYIDRWVVSHLTKWIMARRGENSDWPVPANGINLSRDTLMEMTFSDFTAKHVKSAHLPEGTFAFEIGWDTALLRIRHLMDLQAQLKPEGCRFTLAGFDGSDASFEFLQAARPDFVKLTYGIVKDIDRALAASEKVETINEKCHAMGIQTIAEYVESVGVLEQLRLIGVDFVQGLAVAPPQRLE
jgi:EAL domain-containing protein (putative c-di-GMP-specific phosphodiesterase class I)